MIYDVGDRATIATELRDVDGNMIAADVVLTVTKPDGTTVTPTVSDNGGTGKYKASFDVTSVGTWLYKWNATGAVTAVEGGQLTAENVSRVLVAGLDEFRKQLDRDDYADDAELRLYLEAATNQIEWLVGPLSPTTVTERFMAGDRIALSHFPLISLTSISPVVDNVLAESLDLASVAIDTATATLNFNNYWGGGGGRWAYEVTYVVGRTTIPADIKLAGLIIAQHLWAVQNARWTINAPGDDQMQIAPGSGFMVPYRALELLRPYLSVATVGGIA